MDKMRIVARSGRGVARVGLPPTQTPHPLTVIAPTRRQLLWSVVSSGVMLPGWEKAFAADFETFYGKATPPTSYGGYGGNAEEKPKYRFDYPANWTFQNVNKVQKGTQGIDARVSNPRNRSTVAFVIVLGREGEDNKSYRVTDVEGTFQGFAGADYDIQDAVMSATGTKQSEREIDGQTYYDYQVDSPIAHYMATITINNGKVFAFFVKSADKDFEENVPMFTKILQSFRTL